MSHIEITYNGGALGYDVPPTLVSVPQRAELGEVSMGSISPEDPTAALTLVGHRPIIIEELDCVAQPRLFTGWTVERSMGRSFEQTQFVGPDALVHDTTIADLNAALNFRIITWTDGKRPEESVDARVAWLLASNYLAGPDGVLCEDTGFVQTGFTLLMDATDYRGSYPADVLSDVSARYATPINFFVFWDSDAAKASLFFDYISAATFDCTLSISNDLADQSATCFAPVTESRLERTPEGVYSDVIVNYANGSVYCYLTATATAFVKRGTSISRPHTGKPTTAIQQGDAWLASHNIETDRITTTIRLPASQVGLIQAGMRINIKMTHLTDYVAGANMRIVACNPRPIDDLARYYDVDLELVSRLPATVGAFMVLDGCGSGFYGNPKRYFWPDGGERVTWAAEGTTPPLGYPYQPSSGPVEWFWAGFYDTGMMAAPDGQGIYHGIRVTADGLLSIDHYGFFGGVAGNWSGGVTQITAEVRQSSPSRGTRGVVIHTETQTEPMLGGAYSWTGSFTFALSNIVAYAGDEFEVSVQFVSWVDFAYYASIPAVSTYFSLTGVMDWGITDGGDVGPPIGSTVTGETPTPAPDGTNATFALVDGYLPGSLQVSVDGIPIPASEVTETNPPGVTPDWHGTFTLSWAPDADEVVVVTYRVG